LGPPRKTLSKGCRALRFSFFRGFRPVPSGFMGTPSPHQKTPLSGFFPTPPWGGLGPLEGALGPVSKEEEWLRRALKVFATFFFSFLPRCRAVFEKQKKKTPPPPPLQPFFFCADRPFERGDWARDPPPFPTFFLRAGFFATFCQSGCRGSPPGGVFFSDWLLLDWFLEFFLLLSEIFDSFSVDRPALFLS